MIAVNNEIDKMCQKDYCVPFLTGEKTKSTDSVEILKLKSKAAELYYRENLVRHREDVVWSDEREVADREKAVEKREKAVAQRESDVEAYDRVTHRKREEAEKMLSEALQLKSELEKQKLDIQRAENNMIQQSVLLQQRSDEILEKQKNFKEEVRKEARSIVEREKAAAAKLDEFNKQKQKQAERIANLPKFNDEE